MRTSIICIALGFLLVSGSPVAGQASTDSLQVFAQRFSGPQLELHAERIDGAVRELERRHLDARVAGQLRTLVGDTLAADIPDADLLQRQQRVGMAEAAEHLSAALREVEFAVLFAREAARTTPPRALQPLSPELLADDNGPGRLRQVTDVAQPFLIGAGTVIRSESTTLSTLLIAGGVATAVIGFLTAPEVEQTPAGLAGHLRDATARPGAQGTALRAELEAHRQLMLAYERRAVDLAGEVTRLRREADHVGERWASAPANTRELQQQTRTLAREVSRSSEELERLTTDLFHAAQRINFSLDSYTRGDPRAQAHHASFRERNQVVMRAYNERIGRPLQLAGPTLRSALVRWSALPDVGSRLGYFSPSSVPRLIWSTADFTSSIDTFRPSAFTANRLATSTVISPRSRCPSHFSCMR